MTDEEFEQLPPGIIIHNMAFDAHKNQGCDSAPWLQTRCGRLQNADAMMQHNPTHQGLCVTKKESDAPSRSLQLLNPEIRCS